LSSTAHAADPKAKAAKKKSDDLADDKVIGKQLQWEDSVMGADDKRAELDKIARAQAINKAAAEKAEKEKASREAREAKEKAAAEKAGPQTTKRGGEVALPSLSDEGPSKGSSKSGSTEVSPKLDTAAAAAPPPPLKPADDKFIDKLLKEEGSGKKKKTVASDDKALIDILSTDKQGKPAAPKSKKRDDVDSLLSDADKQPFMGETKVKHETPEWAKPEIRSTPTPAPMVPIKQAKKDDGVIRVVQGAAGTTSSAGARPASASMTTASRSVPTPAAAPPAPGRKSATINSRPGEWADPFAEASSRREPPRKQVAAARSRQVSDDLDEDVRPTRKPAAAPSKREASRGSGDWSDPFSDSERSGGNVGKTGNAKRGGAPAGKAAGRKAADPASWKDPFTSGEPAKPSRPVAGASAKSTHGPVAMRAPAPAPKNAPKVAVARHPAPAAVAEADAPKSQGRWGILKKRH
jgi:hypothetical protein